jgi:cellulose synthase/poly-beta-1,6-N-acetylglucosamine synthase-like glycosyltransferase
MIAENWGFGTTINFTSFLETYHTILLLLTFIYSIGIYYLKKGFTTIYQVSTSDQPSVSIIVSMHNEEENVSDCLDKLVYQDYPEDKLEIIIVNDRSNDKTGDIVDRYREKYPFIQHIKISEIQKGFAPKKFAIDQAINHARGEIILLTDADGRPGNLWVQTMVSFFTRDVGMVLGYAPYNQDSEHQSFWNPILSLEYESHAAVAAASCGLGYPLTCVGTNMGYRKLVFQDLGGFGDYKSTHTGDDDLFLQRVREESDWKIVYASGRNSHVDNQPPQNWRKFYQQRIRYASKGFKYPAKVTIILTMYYILNLMFLLAPLSFIFCMNCILPFFAALLLKAITDFSFLKSAAIFLEDRRYLNLFPVAFIFHIPYVVVFGLLAQLLNFKWGDLSSK